MTKLLKIIKDKIYLRSTSSASSNVPPHLEFWIETGCVICTQFVHICAYYIFKICAHSPAKL